MLTLILMNQKQIRKTVKLPYFSRWNYFHNLYFMEINWILLFVCLYRYSNLWYLLERFLYCLLTLWAPATTIHSEEYPFKNLCLIVCTSQCFSLFFTVFFTFAAINFKCYSWNFKFWVLVINIANNIYSNNILNYW